METSCYNNIVDNSTFTSDLCDPNYCKVTKTLVPTLPNINDNHWFFDYFLYIGGSIHLWMSLGMVISYFLINARNFVLPGFLYGFLKKATGNQPYSFCQKMYVARYIKSSMKCQSLLCYIYRLQRMQLNTPCPYANESLFGLRSLYHIVRIISLFMNVSIILECYVCARHLWLAQHYHCLFMDTFIVFVYCTL